MRARIALLMVAAAALAACESTKAVDTAPPAPVVAVQTTAPDPAPRVVRSALVEDDAEYIAAYKAKKKRAKAATESYDTAAADPVDVAEPASPVSKPDKPAKPDPVEKPTKADAAPVTTADATPAPSTAADATTTGPAPTDTAPDDSATPTTTETPTPAADTGTKSMFSDPSALLQAQFGGFPVWVIALVGLVVLAALLIGLGGRKKPEEVI